MFKLSPKLLFKNKALTRLDETKIQQQLYGHLRGSLEVGEQAADFVGKPILREEQKTSEKYSFYQSPTTRKRITSEAKVKQTKVKAEEVKKIKSFKKEGLSKDGYTFKDAPGEIPVKSHQVSDLFEKGVESKSVSLDQHTSIKAEDVSLAQMTTYVKSDKQFFSKDAPSAVRASLINPSRWGKGILWVCVCVVGSGLLLGTGIFVARGVSHLINASVMHNEMKTGADRGAKVLKEKNTKKQIDARIADKTKKEEKGTYYTVQVAVYAQVDQAKHLVRQLKTKGYQSYYSEVATARGNLQYRVCVGTYPTKDGSLQLLEKLKFQEGFNDCFVKRNRKEG